MMATGVLRAEGLPDGPLDAAAAFHARYLGEARAGFAKADLVVVFPPAGHEQRAWRLAAVQELAREAAPRRVNGIVGDDEQALAEAVAFLASAPGVTGQLLAVDGKSGEIA
jgi:NAD(P)-dependent dehydrogenase (short-subunit alcohol dehydrogenase family)